MFLSTLYPTKPLLTTTTADDPAAAPTSLPPNLSPPFSSLLHRLPSCYYVHRRRSAATLHVPWSPPATPPPKTCLTGASTPSFPLPHFSQSIPPLSAALAHFDSIRNENLEYHILIKEIQQLKEMPFEPRASWFSLKCVEARQLIGHLGVKHCVLVVAILWPPPTTAMVDLILTLRPPPSTRRRPFSVPTPTEPNPITHNPLP